MSETAARQPVIVFCQVSFGLGHWVRTRALVEALVERFDVTLVLGGRTSEAMQVPAGVHVVQLPAKVRGADGHEVPLEPGRELAVVNRERRSILRALSHKLRPAAIVVEYYPFGRYEIELDVMHLVEGSRTSLLGPLQHRAVVVSSLRDIRQTNRRWAREVEALTLDGARALFDAVFVHSDPALARFEDTFPRAAELPIPVYHTGYVVPRRAVVQRSSAPSKRPQILVHVGGGKGGEQLLRAALQAWRLGDLAGEFELRVLTGIFQDDEVNAEIEQLAAGLEHVEICEWEPDLIGALERARVSVSRCGYNTALDLVRARTPALVVPYEPPHEDEQRNRAERLAARGLLRCLPAAELTPERLIAEIRQTLAFEPASASLDLDGAAYSTALLTDLIERHRATPLD